MAGPGPAPGPPPHPQDRGSSQQRGWGEATRRRVAGFPGRDGSGEGSWRSRGQHQEQEPSPREPPCGPRGGRAGALPGVAPRPGADGRPGKAPWSCSRCPQLHVRLETGREAHWHRQAQPGPGYADTTSPVPGDGHRLRGGPGRHALLSGLPSPAPAGSAPSLRAASGPVHAWPLWASVGEAAQPCGLTVTDHPSSEGPGRPHGGRGGGHTGRLLPSLLLGSEVAASCRIPKHPHSPSEGKAPKAVLRPHPGPWALDK